MPTAGGGPATFTLDICGSIHAPGGPHDAVLSISITDVSDGEAEPRPVLHKTGQVNFHDPAHFCYKTDIGTLQHETTSLADWTTVARLSAAEILLPRTGRCVLRFEVAVMSRQTDRQFAAAQCTCAYDNSEAGYLDRQQAVQRAKTLAVGLAFAASAVDGKLFACEIDLIKHWAIENIEQSTSREQAERSLEKAFNKTVSFFRGGGQIDARKMCGEILAIAPPAERREILELCLRVVQTKGHAAAEELELLGNISCWLGIDDEEFRTMMERILPVTMHEVADTEAILGINANMTCEQTRRQLNREYAKWSSRVTTSDPAVRSQAEQMLRLLAEARKQYVGTASLA